MGLSWLFKRGFIILSGFKMNQGGSLEDFSLARYYLTINLGGV